MKKSIEILKDKVQRAEVKVTTFVGRKVRERRKSKGALSTIEILGLIVIALVITYPLYKDTATAYMNKAKTWLGVQQDAIFK